MSPHRITFTDEDSGITYTGTWAYADNPVVDGTLMNKAAFLKDATATALNLSGADPTVDDALAALSAHKARHATGGADALSPADINAAALNSNSKVNASQASSHIVSVLASKTLALSDAGTMQKVNPSSANVTITVPKNATVAFPVGTEIEFVRYNAYTVTFAADEDVTIISAGSALTISDQYGCAVLKKMEENTWLLAGGLA